MKRNHEKKKERWLCYSHSKPDGEIFYIGIGNIKRPYKKDKRSEFWYNIVNKYGYLVNIIIENSTWEDVVEMEKYLIKKIGRRDLGLGTLVNLTDGGDGTINVSIDSREKSASKYRGRIPWNKGIPMTHAAKEKSKKSHTGNKHSKETKEKISLNHRHHQTDETKKKISDSVKELWNRKLEK